LEPLLKAGADYDKIDFRDLPESVLAQIEGKTFVLSKKWLTNETLETSGGKKRGEEITKALLEEKDPLYQVRQSKKTLQEFWDNFFSKLGQTVPELPSVEDRFKGENFKEAENIRNKILTAKKIAQIYGQDSKVFKRLLASKTNKDRPYLQELIDLPPREFWLRNPKGETYLSYAAVDFSRTPEAMGYVTPKNFQILDGAFEFKNTSGEDETLSIFVIAEGKLRIFDSGTGAERDPKLPAALEFQEAKNKFLDAFPFKEEKSAALRDLLEQYLKTFSGDATSLPKIQKQAIETLANIPPLLDTVNAAEDWNLLLVQLIFERLKVLGNSEQGLAQQKIELGRLQRKAGDRHEDLNALQYLFMSAGFYDGFSLKSDAVRQFIKEVLLSALQSDEMKSTLTEFGYPRFFEYLGEDFENVQIRIREIIKQQPNAVSEEDLSRWKESNALGQKDAAISSIQGYFIRREFAAVREREEAQRKAEEEARQKAADEEKRRKDARRAQQKEPKLNLEPAERERRRTHAELYGGDSIGASSIGFRHQNDFVIVDAGKRPNSGQGPKYPAFGQNGMAKPSKIFLTHTHIDHAADLPRLIGLLDQEVDVYMTQGSFALLPTVLRGDLRESNRRKQKAPYTEAQLEELLKSPYLHVLKVGQWYALSKDTRVQYVGDEETGEAGHLLGAAPVVLATRYGNTGVLWDISVHDQGVVKGLKKWPANIPVHNAFV
ncbi:MAG TPA: hypothetical protein VJC08_04600, partial [bacterium]|nr:hypothetical protein [bacterium]